MSRMWLAAAALVLAGAGCASTGPSGSNGSGQQLVPVITDPTGATARAAGQEIRTPGSILVPTGVTYLEIEISKEGYESSTVILTPDSAKFRDCFQRATDPNSPAPAPGFISDEGVYVLWARLLSVLGGCAYQAGQVQLQPNLVFVRLYPLPQIPIAPRRPN